MSDMYAIKGSTLTAIGDAIRNKTISQSELPVLNVEKAGVSYNSKLFYEFPISVKKVKITGILYYYKLESGIEIMNTGPSGAQGLGVAPGSFTSVSDVRNNENYTIIWNGYSANIDGVPSIIEFETMIENNSFTFVATKGYNGPDGFSMNFTAIGLDENGNEFKYTPLEMADAINELMTIPDEAFNITGNCQYRFAYNGSNWLIESAGDKITTKDISNASCMFQNCSELKEIPFEINMKKDCIIEYMFANCKELLHSPIVNYPELTNHIKFGYVFSSCYKLQEIPEWLVDLLERDYNLPTKNTTFGPWMTLFEYCYSIRKIPDRVMKSIRNDNMTGNYYGVCYCKPFSAMYCLDELVGVHCDNYNYTSNQFSGFFKYLYRAKDITFATNDDGTPVVRPWKSQTIDLSNFMGYAMYNGDILTDATTTITADKQVIDDTTYQALKNDPDWFTTKIEYSRYNHDSAVNTINSLPDCSATGTNTIKFNGQAGALTDGGAINTLTEEEIAVAVSKGWNVAFA